ncbi:TolC family protein [Pontivivens insulae]|uniref:TolC family protein n=1 Tax=Pontivivens insulae TaxID=1639689 RepID=UPI0013C2F850|nr:TolC family protein [Pontivivens insulae]
MSDAEGGAILEAGEISFDPSRELLSFAEAAVNQSPRVRAAGFALQGASARVREQQGAFYPQVSVDFERNQVDQAILFSSQPSFSGNTSEFPTETFGLRVSQTVYDAEASAGIDVAMDEREAARARTDSAFQDELDTVLTLYLDGIEALERYQAADAAVRYLSTVNRIERLEVEAGRLRASARADTVADLAQAETDREIAVADFQTRSEAFCRLAQVEICPAIQSLALDGVLPAIAPLTEEERERVRQNPDIRAIEQALQAATSEIDQARGAFYPRVTLDFAREGVNRGGSLFDGASQTLTDTLTLNIGWDIYNGGTRIAATARQIAEASELRHLQEADIRDLLRALETASDAIETLYENDQRLSRVLGARAVALRLANDEVEAGLANPVAAAQARYAYVLAQVGRATVRRNYLLAVVARARATGSLDFDMVQTIGALAVDDRAARRALDL